MFSGLPDWRLIRQNIGQAKRILLREGPRALGVRMSLKLKRFLGLEAIGHFDFGYESWRKKQASKLKADGLNTADALIKSMDPPVLFSILVPVYDVEEKWLDKMLGSVERQLYPHWQLCLVDDCSNSPHIKPWLEACRDRDPRITIGMNEVNSGIAATSNHALTLAKGNYIVLLDHDDELAEDAWHDDDRGRTQLVEHRRVARLWRRGRAVQAGVHQQARRAAPGVLRQDRRADVPAVGHVGRGGHRRRRQQQHAVDRRVAVAGRARGLPEARAERAHVVGGRR